MAKEVKMRSLDTKSMNINHTNLYYFIGDNNLEKIAMIQCVVVALHRLSIPTLILSNWLQISQHDTQQFIKAGLNPRLTKDKHYVVNLQTLDKNINYFLTYQHPVYLNNQDIDYVIELLLSNLSAYQIAKETVLSQALISYLRHGKRRITNLKLSTVNKLVHCYKHHKKWLSWQGMCTRLNHHVNVKYCAIIFTPKKNILFSCYYKHKLIEIDFSSKKPVWQEKDSLISVPNFMKELFNQFVQMPLKKRAWNDAQYMIKDLEKKPEQVAKLWI